MLLRCLTGTALAAAIICLPLAAPAAENSSIGMSEAVVANCSAIPTSFAVTLPDYDPIAPRFNYAHNGATFQCTKGATPVFSFDEGPNGTSNGYLRRMSDGNGHTLTYMSELCFSPALYHTYNEILNGACTYTVQSSAAQTQSVVTAYPSGNGGTELIYLQLYNFVYPGGGAWGGAGQDVSVGHYTDSFTMTLNY